MTALKSVLGCVGLCRVGFANPTQFEASNGAALRAVCRVCWVWGRARAYACVLFRHISLPGDDAKKGYARAEKPNKPNTPNTVALKALIYKGFKCVGFVLGWAFCVGLGDAA